MMMIMMIIMMMMMIIMMMMMMPMTVLSLLTGDAGGDDGHEVGSGQTVKDQPITGHEGSLVLLLLRKLFRNREKI